MPLTIRGQSVDSANPIHKKRYEDISFAFSFAASAAVSWTGLTLKGQLRNVNDALLWDSGNVSASVAGDGSASASITIPSATTGLLEEGTYYVDFFFWGASIGNTATKTYLLKIADGPTNL
jgi:hypothetical protein